MEKSADEEPKLSFAQKARIIASNITVEPVLILYILPECMSYLAVQNLSLEKACRVNLGFTDDVCDALSARNSSGYSDEQEIAVQKMVSFSRAFVNSMQSIIPCFMLLFWGSWSDRHNRRKPCMMFPVFGAIVAMIVYLVCTVFFRELGMYYNMTVEAMTPAVTGGWFAMFMGVYSYIGTVSTVEDRTVRIGAANMFSDVSMTLGVGLSGILFGLVGFYGIFSMSLAMYSIGFIYGYFRVKDCCDYEGATDGKVETEEVEEKKGFLADFFDYRHILGTLRLAFQKQGAQKKRKICLIIVLVMLINGPLYGEFNVLYLMLTYRFKWTEFDYSVYSTFYTFTYTIGTIFGLMFCTTFGLIFFSKFLKVNDAVLGLIASCFKILSCLIFAFAPSSGFFYLGAVVEMLNGTSFIATRSIISKLVPNDELGKINSLFGVAEALVPLFYGPLYTLIYNATLTEMPGAFYLVGGSLMVPAALIYLWLHFDFKREAEEEEVRKRSEGEPLKTIDDTNNNSKEDLKIC